MELLFHKLKKFELKFKKDTVFLSKQFNLLFSGRVIKVESMSWGTFSGVGRGYGGREVDNN